MAVHFPASVNQHVLDYLGSNLSDAEEISISQGDVEILIANLFENVVSTQNAKESFLDKMAALRSLRNSNILARCSKLKAASSDVQSIAIQSIAILGAGLAGLTRAILAILNGNEVRVIEKRAENQEGRLNGIILSSETVAVLKECGIYHYLKEKQLFGSSPNENRFPHSVAIKDLETAMKAVITDLLPGEEVILYRTQLNNIIKNATKSVSLALKVAEHGKRLLHNVDLIVVAEGSKSDTVSKFFKGRRIEVLSPLPVIGGIFKTGQASGKSFTYTLDNSARGIVLFTPGLCSIGCLPLSKNADSLIKLSSALKKVKSDEGERRKNQFFKGLVDQFFESEAAATQKAPTFDKNLLVTTSTIFSDFTLPFCGRVGTKSLFFLCGDTLSQIDATSGRGANNAIESAKDFLSAFKNSTSGDQILEKYATKTVERIDESMRNVKCMRAVAGLPANDNVYEFALFQLQHHKLVERLQAVVGTTLSRLVLSTRVGERCFRYVAKVLKQ